MFDPRAVLLFGLLAGLLSGAAVFWLQPWTRAGRRYLVIGLATLVGFVAWNLTLNVTDARGFDVDAPIIPLSWADAGSGVLAFAATALVLGLVAAPAEPARRVVGTAGLAGLAAMLLDLVVL